MRISYHISGETYELVLDDADEFAVYVDQVLLAITDAHPALPNSPELQLSVSEGLLDGFAQDQTEVDLGNLKN